MERKLRIGVLIDGVASLRRWELRLFERIARDEGCVLACLLLAPGSGCDAPPPLQQRPVPALDVAVYGLVAGLDRRLLAARPEGDAPCCDVDLADLPQINLDGDDAAQAEALAGQRLDVVLDHSGRPVGAFVHAAARHGVWWLDPACERGTQQGPAGFWESFEGAPVTGVTLKRRDPLGRRDRVLARAFFNTKQSLARNRDLLRERSASLVLRELRRLVCAGMSTGEPAQESAAAGATPDALTALHYGGRVAGRIARRALDEGLARIGYRPQMWTLFFGRGPIEQAELSQLVEARPGRNELWADPFLFRREGRDYVFFENYNYASGLGRISAGVLEGDELRVLGDALVRDYHLSYPYIFEDAGDIYMLPETYNSGRIEIWRCRSFPLEWELYATAFEGRRAVDSILFRDESNAGQWWLFTSLADGDYHDFSELHVFAVDGPALTGITPHALNPVVMDSRTARNGGRVFRKDGRLYRSSQNNSHGVYGWGLNLMEIEHLDLLHYAERPVFALTPESLDGLVACHHMDTLGDRFVIDGCRRYGGF